MAVFWNEDENRRTDRTVGFTERIFVRPPWRQRGIARCLIAAGLAHLRAHGLREALLEVRAENAAALGLYRSLGYEVARETYLYALDVA